MNLSFMKSAYIIGPRLLVLEFGMVNQPIGYHGWESFGVVRFDLGPILQGQTRIVKLKSPYYSLIIGHTGWSFGVVRFDLEPFLQGQTRIAIPKSACLLLVIEVWDGKPTYKKSWARNLLVWSDLTLNPSFKVKRG